MRLQKHRRMCTECWLKTSDVSYFPASQKHAFWGPLLLRMMEPSKPQQAPPLLNYYVLATSNVRNIFRVL